MTTTAIDGLVTRATERPLPTALALGRAGLPYALGLYMAFIFLYYLPYKFYPGNFVFEVLESWSGLTWVEPYLRYWVGGAEAVASLLLLIPGLQVAGAALALGIMSGAIFFHLFTPLGVDPFNDGGKLFTEACTVWTFAVAILVMRRREILPLLARFATDPRLPRIPGGPA
jgi:hypothetical protein